jgi:hypothetical protein
LGVVGEKRWQKPPEFFFEQRAPYFTIRISVTVTTSIPIIVAVPASFTTLGNSLQ